MANRTNEQWLADLKSSGPDQNAALDDLRVVILKGLPYALSKWMRPDDSKYEGLAEEVAQETLLRVLDRLDSFQGRSRFTTWVHTIAVHIAISELRRKKWQERSLDNLLDGDPEEDTPAMQMADNAPSADTELSVEQQELMDQVQHIILKNLSEKQREAMMSLAVAGMPQDVVAERMGMSRNALYKLLHDARLRLKSRLQAEGLTLDDVLSAFSNVG